MPGQRDCRQLQPDTLGDEQVDDGQGDRDALAPCEHLVEVAVERIRVIIGVAVQAEFVEQHAVEHAALFPGGRRLGDQLAAARGQRVQLGAAGAHVEIGVDRAAEQQRAGLKLVVERTDEAPELAHRVGEIQLAQKPGGLQREHPVGLVGELPQQVHAFMAVAGKFGDQGGPHRGGRIVEQLRQGLALGDREFLRFHGAAAKVVAAAAQRGKFFRANY